MYYRALGERYTSSITKQSMEGKMLEIKNKKKESISRCRSKSTKK